MDGRYCGLGPAAHVMYLSKDNSSQLISRVDAQERTARTGSPKAPEGMEGPEGDRFQMGFPETRLMPTLSCLQSTGSDHKKDTSFLNFHSVLGLINTK